MVEPRYQELLEEAIPHVSRDGVRVAVIAGDSYGASVSGLYKYKLDTETTEDLSSLETERPWAVASQAQ